jgi:hypothetical protein
MNIVADHRISETRDFTYQFVPFPTSFGRENLGSENARSAHFFVPPAEPPAVTPEKSLAAGVLKQAARDLRRFCAATRGVKRELYVDAYSWIAANDFSWTYSFVNVCKLLDFCPEVVRAEILTDASLSWFDYWTRRAGRASRGLRASFIRVFASRRNPKGAEASQLASCV